MGRWVLVMVNPYHVISCKEIEMFAQKKNANKIPMEKLKGLSLFKHGKGKVTGSLVNNFQGMALF